MKSARSLMRWRARLPRKLSKKSLNPLRVPPSSRSKRPPVQRISDRPHVERAVPRTPSTRVQVSGSTVCSRIKGRARDRLAFSFVWPTNGLPRTSAFHITGAPKRFFLGSLGTRKKMTSTRQPASGISTRSCHQPVLPLS